MANQNEPLSFSDTEKAAKNADRQAIDTYEVGQGQPLEQMVEHTVDKEIMKEESAGGDFGIFAQDINTDYAAVKVALYEAKLHPGGFKHPLTGQDLPVQTTITQQILDAIQAKG